MNKKAYPATLRKAALKATSSRISVLKILEENRAPMSAQAIIDSVKGAMDQATVYRILKTLKEKGIVRQVDLRHNHAHYEIFQSHTHHHLICVSCGRLEDVHNCEVGETYASVIRHAKHFVEIKEHALEFYGVCKKCSHKTRVL